MQNIQVDKWADAATFLQAGQPGKLKLHLRRKGGIDTVYNQGKGHFFYTEMGIGGGMYEL